ncbi:TetR family transcriptional regulator C-terminal domain-containing protein [Solirhodobacter olei]|uniref:TetR family transcriptional regulator C-terminal domain-containing protein n=1 Tax=Solirhodobacter olei TaxID=2493082 RepID=UPI0019D45EA8|nr:TetR family transcriptional regulator C-terminal domain-containing protein [Solirhodobacter olei]
MTAIPDPGGRARKAPREMRRQQLIEATIDCLSRRGYADTTMADIADRAGLSRGIVNFHFESKDNLLIATLQFMADEYATHWMGAYDRAGPAAAARLQALVAADFDRRVCTRRKLAAWFAFWGEAKSRPTYQALCGARDKVYQEALSGLVEALKQEAGYGYDAPSLALSLCSMLEGLWFRLMMGDGLTRDGAHAAARAWLGVAFPRHFAPDGARVT